MSLVIATMVPDGIALAADSRTSVGDPTAQLATLTDFTEKLVQVGRFGIMTTGWNVIKGTTIANHLKAFRAEVNDTMNITEVASALARYFGLLYESHVAETGQRQDNGQVVVEFLLCGEDAGAFFTHVVRISDQQTSAAPNMSSTPTTSLVDALSDPSNYSATIVPVPGPNAVWSGIGDTLRRLILGYDSARVSLPAPFATQLNQSAPLIVFPSFTMQDAINFSRFCIEATIMMLRFSLGHSYPKVDHVSVGGHIDIAIIDRDGFRWIAQKTLGTTAQLSDALLPPPE